MCANNPLGRTNGGCDGMPAADCGPTVCRVLAYMYSARGDGGPPAAAGETSGSRRPSVGTENVRKKKNYIILIFRWRPTAGERKTRADKTDGATGWRGFGTSVYIRRRRKPIRKRKKKTRARREKKTHRKRWRRAHRTRRVSKRMRRVDCGPIVFIRAAEWPEPATADRVWCSVEETRGRRRASFRKRFETRTDPFVQTVRTRFRARRARTGDPRTEFVSFELLLFDRPSSRSVRKQMLYNDV